MQSQVRVSTPLSAPSAGEADAGEGATTNTTKATTTQAATGGVITTSGEGHVVKDAVGEAT